MEQGAFQTFCLDFLPLYNAKYKGLERHGGTVDGKTRKGTPDLIKTLNSGNQIAVQCSVEKNYWKIPKDKNKLPQCKPCRDIDNCLKYLSNVSEIILCSSQEIPTDSADIKARISLYAKNKTKARITLLNLVDIEENLIDNIENPEYKKLYQSYFPGIDEQIINYRDLQRYKLAVELTSERPISIDAALNVTKDVMSKISLVNEEDIKKYVLQKIDELKSRFERHKIPAPGLVKRDIPKDSYLMKPTGIIQSLLGIPKIGKTSLVAQCAIDWQASNFNIRWFDSPIDKIDGRPLVNDISRAIWFCFLSAKKASQLASGILNIHSLDQDEIIYKCSNPTIFVLDNAEALSLDILNLICSVLGTMKTLNLFSNIGFIFISNKGLKHLCPAISKEYTAPAWSKEELKELLLSQLPDYECYQNDKYLQFVTTMSSGHPLIALALARKYPSLKQLISSSFKAPSIADENLTADVKRFLFEDILADDKESRDYVLRLSPLIFKARERVINAIKKKIKPEIAKPFKLVLDKLVGTVIEGDEKQGYSVSSIYKEIARSQLDTRLQHEIYDVASAELLTPKGTELNAIDVINGGFYALLADNLERFFYWSIMLLQSAIKTHLPKTQVNAIIDRLEFIVSIFVKPPDDPKLLLMYYATLMSMAVIYSKNQNYEKAIELLDRIKGPLKEKEYEDKSLLDHLLLLSEVAKINKMTLVAKDHPEKAMRILSSIDLNKVKKLPFIAPNIADFLTHLFAIVPIKDIPKDLMKQIISSIGVEDENEMATLVRIILHLAVKAHSEKVSPQVIKQLFGPSNHITEIMCIIFDAQYALDNQENEKAISLIGRALTLLQQRNLCFNAIKSILQQVEGDAYDRLNLSKKAKDSYLKSMEYADSEVCFEYAWANYKLGLLSEDPTEAKDYFRKSSLSFKSLRYENYCARSEGERGVALMQLGCPLEFARIAEYLIRGYYLDNKQKYAPVVTVITSQLARLVYTLQNKPVPKIENEGEEKISPELNRGVYAGILHIAKPQAGPIIAFYYLGKNYSLLDNIDQAIKLFHTALSFECTTQLDRVSILMTSYELLNLTIPDGNKDEIKKVMIRCLSIDAYQINAPPKQDPKNFIINCVFFKLDKTIQSLDRNQQKVFMDLLAEVEQDIPGLDLEYSDWLLSEVIFRRAKICEFSDSGIDIKYNLWMQVYNYGIKAVNEDLILQAGRFLGFIYIDKFPIRSIAESQFNVIKKFPFQKENPSFIKNYGQNLFAFWHKFQWRRLSEYDYEVKASLLDGAKVLKSVGFCAENAGPVMILLLASIYKFEGDTIDWAIEKIKEHNTISRIPDSLKKRIIYFKQ